MCKYSLSRRKHGEKYDFQNSFLRFNIIREIVVAMRETDEVYRCPKLTN
jgi:hypothetical protein